MRNARWGGVPRIFQWALWLAQFVCAAALAQDVQPPTTPTGLSAVASASTTVALTWGASTDNVGVAGYQVERCQGTGCNSSYSQIDVTSPQYADSGRSPSTTYGYRVRARDAAINYSAYAGPVYVTMPAASDANRAQEFQYDEAGRLQRVVSPEREVAYTLDPAGNRTALDSTQGRGWPSSINVPSTSASGNYRIEWGASTGSTSRYELFESNNAGFSGAVEVYDGPAQLLDVMAKPDGTYYYRVRACTVQSCGPHRAGSNPIVVTRPPVPGVPATLTVPTGDIDGNYSITWGAATGTVTDYELYEALNGGSFGASPVYSGNGQTTTASITGRGNGSYSYRVRACNTASSCSSYRDGSNAIVVTLPPSVPGAVVVPAYDNTGSFTVSWGAATGQLTQYELLESAATQETQVYSGTSISSARSGRPDGVYSYRVRACNTSAACSNYTSERGMAGLIYVDRIAPTPPASLIMLGDRRTLSWSGGSQDSAGSGAGSGISHWNIYRNSSLIGSSATTSFNDASQPGNITLNYVVKSVDRAGNESSASPTYTTFVDTIPPTTPGNLRTTSVTYNSVSLAWDASTDSSGIARYEITRTPGTTVSTLDASTSYVDDTAASSTSYTYQVVALDGQSVRSAPASLNVTTPSGAPGVPTMNNAGFGIDGDGNYTISWVAPTTGTVAHYEIEEQRQGIPPVVTVFTVTGTSRAFTGGTHNEEYWYRVRACSSGNACSGWSATRKILVCIGGCTN